MGEGGLSTLKQSNGCFGSKVGGATKVQQSVQWLNKITVNLQNLGITGKNYRNYRILNTKLIEERK